MDVQAWITRREALQRSLEFMDPPCFKAGNLLAVRVQNLGARYECVVLDLGLSKTFGEAHRCRKPKETAFRLSVSGLNEMQLLHGQDYMLVGAEIRAIQGPLLSELFWPRLTATTGHVRLTTACDIIGDVVEFYAGGFNSWTHAARLLPLNVTMRVDFKTLAIQMMKINQCPKTDEKPEQSVPVQGDVADMRILERLSTEEGIMASPPCQPFSGLGKGLGLDAYSAKSWDSLFQVLRISQRRFLVLENVRGLQTHADFREIMRAMGFCGYTLVAQRVCDAASLGCAARPRVLMVFWNTADCQGLGASGVQVPSFAKLGPRLPCKVAGSVWHDMPAHIAACLTLSAMAEDHPQASLGHTCR